MGVVRKKNRKGPGCPQGGEVWRLGTCRVGRISKRPQSPSGDAGIQGKRNCTPGGRVHLQLFWLTLHSSTLWSLFKSLLLLCPGKARPAQPDTHTSRTASLRPLRQLYSNGHPRILGVVERTPSTVPGILYACGGGNICHRSSRKYKMPSRVSHHMMT